MEFLLYLNTTNPDRYENIKPHNRASIQQQDRLEVPFLESCCLKG